jgi:hypothetical protein
MIIVLQCMKPHSAMCLTITGQIDKGDKWILG